MTGMSAHERHIRDELKLTDDDVGGTAPNECVIPIPAGVLRGILADIDMWREIGTREVELMIERPKFVSASCYGERCFCGQPADHKVEETIFHDDPVPNRHGFTSYVCHTHFVLMMGPAAR